MYKEGIYDYRGAKLGAKPKVKNPYGSWRYNMYFDVNEEVRKWGTANTRKYLT